MNRLDKLFAAKQRDILNIYFTAGYPNLDDTGKIIRALDRSGADLIELGMPYSDPLADGLDYSAEWTGCPEERYDIATAL